MDYNVVIDNLIQDLKVVDSESSSEWRSPM